MLQGNPKMSVGVSQVSIYGKKEFASEHNLLVPYNAQFTVVVTEPSEKSSRDLSDEELLGLLDDTLVLVDVTLTLDVFGDGQQLILEKYMVDSPVPFNMDFVKETVDYRAAMERAAIAWFQLEGE